MRVSPTSLIALAYLASTSLAQQGSISCGERVYGNNEGRTSFVGDVSGDSIYDFEVFFGQSVSFDTCSSETNFDTQLYLYSPDRTGQLLDENDDGSAFGAGCDSLDSYLTYLVEPGSYQIVVDGFGSAEGDFGLCVDCGDGCPNESSGLAVGAIVGTAVAILFCCFCVCLCVRISRNNKQTVVVTQPTAAPAVQVQTLGQPRLATTVVSYTPGQQPMPAVSMQPPRQPMMSGGTQVQQPQWVEPASAAVPQASAPPMASGNVYPSMGAPRTPMNAPGTTEGAPPPAYSSF